MYFVTGVACRNRKMGCWSYFACSVVQMVVVMLSCLLYYNVCVYNLEYVCVVCEFLLQMALLSLRQKL